MKKIPLLSFAAAVAVSGSALAYDFAGYVGGGYSFVPVVSGAKSQKNDPMKIQHGGIFNGNTQQFSSDTADYRSVEMDKKGNAVAGFVGFGYYVMPEVFVGIEGNYDQINNSRYANVDSLSFDAGTGPQVKFSRMGASLVVNGTVFSNEYVGLAMKIGAGYQRVELSQNFSDEAIAVLGGRASNDTTTVANYIAQNAITAPTGTSTLNTIIGDTETIDTLAITGAQTYSALYNNAFANTKKANTFGVLAGVEVFFPVVQDYLDVFVAGTWNYTKPIKTIGDKLNVTLTADNSGTAASGSSTSSVKHTGKLYNDPGSYISPTYYAVDDDITASLNIKANIPLTSGSVASSVEYYDLDAVVNDPTNLITDSHTIPFITTVASENTIIKTSADTVNNIPTEYYSVRTPIHGVNVLASASNFDATLAQNGKSNLIQTYTASKPGTTYSANALVNEITKATVKKSDTLVKNPGTFNAGIEHAETLYDSCGSGSAEQPAIAADGTVTDTINTFAASSPAHQLLVNVGLRAKF